MRSATITPTNVERSFGEGEIIVSKTDLKGFITYANSVFLRVSDYAEADVIGKPHNIIRHPDMPRCIFKLLWETIKAGNEIFAYVKNMASDGSHYWVLAHVTPSVGPDGRTVGYHSNRRCPRRAAVQEVEALYHQLVAEEKRRSRPDEAMAASGQALARVLEAKGLTYEAWVWGVIKRGELAA